MRVVLLAATIFVALSAATVTVAVSPGQGASSPRAPLSTLLLCVLLSIPHLMYAHVWKCPQWWIKMLGPGKGRALDNFAGIAAFLKPVQLLCYMGWWSGMLLPEWNTDLLFYVSASVGLGLMIFGQVKTSFSSVSRVLLLSASIFTAMTAPVLADAQRWDVPRTGQDWRVLRLQVRLRCPMVRFPRPPLKGNQ